MLSRATDTDTGCFMIHHRGLIYRLLILSEYYYQNIITLVGHSPWWVFGSYLIMCLTFSLCADVCCLCFWMSNLFYFVNHGLYACLTVVFPLWLSVSPLGVLPALCCCEYLKLLHLLYYLFLFDFLGFFTLIVCQLFQTLCASSPLKVQMRLICFCLNLLPPACCMFVHVYLTLGMHHKHIDVEILRSLIWWRH